MTYKMYIFASQKRISILIMKEKLTLCFFVSILFLIASCGDSKPQVAVKNEANLGPKKDILLIDSITENRYAFLKEIISSKEKMYVKVDYVDYLTGKEALSAEWRDQAYFIDGVDTISNITNGYYISNINTKIRTFKIGKNAIIKNIIDDEGAHKIKPPKKLNIEQLQEYVDTESLLMIYVEDGIIKRIDERFLP